MSINIPPTYQKDPEEENQDLGFGDKLNFNVRLLNDDGSFNVYRKGKSSWNTYKFIVKMNWGKFFIFLILAYITINLLFALLYMVDGSSGIEGMQPGNFWKKLEQTFYLSVQTFTTVGYGKLSPTSTWSNMVSVINSFVGLMSFALATGLFFTKFTMPRDHILFSDHIIIAPFEGEKALMVRIVNEMDNNIVDLHSLITMTWLKSEGGVVKRKFVNLSLTIDRVYLFPLNWTMVHKIDSSSPLYGKNKNDLIQSQTEILVMVKGYDDTYGKPIYANRSYRCKDLTYGAKFEAMYYTEGEITVLDLNKIDDHEDVILRD